MFSVETWAAQATAPARLPSATLRLLSLEPGSDALATNDPVGARPARSRIVIEFDLPDATGLWAERTDRSGRHSPANLAATDGQGRRHHPIRFTNLPYLAHRLAQDLSLGEPAMRHAAAEAAYRRGADLTTRLLGNHAPVDFLV